MDPFVAVARIVKSRGIKGEVAAEILTDVPDRFACLAEVIVRVNERRFWERIERFWFHQSRVILKFEGRDSPEAVAGLIGGSVEVPEEQRAPLPGGLYYHSDLVGCRILESGEFRGEVTGILELGGAGANLVVNGRAGLEYMVPLVRDFVLNVDVARKEIRVKLPPGLLELAEPRERRPKDRL